MIRSLRRSDVHEYVELLRANFPEDQQFIGSKPEVWEKIAGRFFRLDVRFVLGLLELLGRPIVDAFGVEAGGKLVATSLLTYRQNAGYVSSVTVAEQYRGRGYARSLLETCIARAKRRRCRQVILDVLEGNTPAISLYTKLGFRPFRTVSTFDYVAPSPLASEPAPPRGVRLLKRSDAPGLVAMIRRSTDRQVDAIEPMSARDLLAGGGVVARVLRSTSEGWVLTDDGEPLGFLRTAVSEAMTAGGIIPFFLAPAVSGDRALEFLDFGRRWCHRRGRLRVVSASPVDRIKETKTLEAAGFRPAHRATTMSLATGL